jgi:hypothetical protein
MEQLMQLNPELERQTEELKKELTEIWLNPEKALHALWAADVNNPYKNKLIELVKKRGGLSGLTYSDMEF